MLYLIITLAVLASVYFGATKLVVPAIDKRTERLKVEARKAFDEETDRLEKLCEIGPYSPLSLWIAAEEERERQAAINAMERERNEIRWRIKKERQAALAAEGERRLKERKEARVCVDGGEHMVMAGAMKCRICGKPFNPFRPKSFDEWESHRYGEDHRRPNPTAGELYAAAKRRHAAEQKRASRERYIAAGYLENGQKALTELTDDFLDMVREHEMMEQRWRRIEE